MPAEPGERVWRRRNKLTDSDGLMREHARLIAAMFKGKVSMETGETLSRAMARQAVMCKEVEDRELLIAMAASAEKLKQFRSMHATAIPASFEEKRR